MIRSLSSRCAFTLNSPWNLGRPKGLLRRASSQVTSYPTSRKKVIFSGIQPTGIPHLGNYLGAIRPWVELQNNASPDTEIFICIVDLHALTSTGIRERPLKEDKRNLFASLLACGLDPARCTIFYQSDVLAHTELHWLLSCQASMGWLARMTQWKSKLDLDSAGSTAEIDTSDSQDSRLKLGLFSYPVLQAADVLLYNTTDVPVGEDQAQHIEFTRIVAKSFNSTYGKGKEQILIPPTCSISPAKRVRSLTEPDKKMSKSQGSANSRILLTDSSEDIARKFKGALTDSNTDEITYDPERRPGVANLLQIMANFDDAGRDPLSLAEQYRHSSMRELKKVVTESVAEGLSLIRERYLDQTSGSRERNSYMDEIELQGAKHAREVSTETMSRVKHAIEI